MLEKLVAAVEKLLTKTDESSLSEARKEQRQALLESFLVTVEQELDDAAAQTDDESQELVDID